MAADKYFKEYIYNDVKYDDLHSDEALRELERNKVVFLDDDPFPDYFEYLNRLPQKNKKKKQK